MTVVAATSGNNQSCRFQQFTHCPDVIAYTSCHRRRHSQRLVDAPKVRIYQWVRYRMELGTCVYFMRFIEPPAVLILDFSESPLDPNAIRKLVASGNAHVLAKL
jgi:hypothetical protein